MLLGRAGPDALALRALNSEPTDTNDRDAPASLVEPARRVRKAAGSAAILAVIVDDSSPASNGAPTATQWALLCEEGAAGFMAEGISFDIHLAISIA